MRVKVKEMFRDKNSKKIIKVATFLDISKERYQEIKEFVEIVEDNLEERVKKSTRRELSNKEVNHQ